MGRYPVDRPMTRHGIDKGYWELRKDRDLYKIMRLLAEQYAANAKSAIDVGCYIGGFICELDWIQDRTATDLNDWSKEWKDVEGVTFKKQNAFELPDSVKYDLVISNQTIEHVEDAKGFAEKLCALGKTVLISTTYEVEAGLIEGHIQDPISLDKFVSWFPREPKNISIAYEKPFNNILGVF